MTTLYLASGSPRRQELLTQLGLAFERLVPGIEEQRAMTSVDVDIRIA